MSESNAEDLKPSDILKNYKKLTPSQISSALSNPQLTPHILSIVSKFSDEQLKVAIPFMSNEHIRSSVPKLLLQQTGVAIQEMNPSQIQTCIKSITKDDRAILMQNICLLTSCSNREELQSFISFVDPLAIAVAVENSEMAKTIVESCGMMTLEQIRLVIPLISSQQIRDMVFQLEHDSQIEAAISMISEKEKIVKMVKQELSDLQKMKQEIFQGLIKVKEKLPALEDRMKKLEEDQDTLVRCLKNTKNEIEGLQQKIRELQASLKLPMRILDPQEQEEAYSAYQSLVLEVKELGHKVREQFSYLSCENGPLLSLQRRWNMKREVSSQMASQEEDYLFVDDEGAILLYEAVKKIGNPEVIGTEHYPMTWRDIIAAGFRESKDFGERGIATMEQLQKFIVNFRSTNSSE